ncbi:MAG: isochorismatase family protein, partial [Sphingopyxis sp.]|nr:isochorismatase family protein [Sphingopyxis sp.]
MRGTACSGGAYDFFEPLQTTDGYDIVEASVNWTLNGGGIGSNSTVTLHAFRGITIGPEGGFFDNGGEHETGLGSYLRERKVTDVYLLGLATDYCVRATALDSCKLGFRTWLIQDACRGVELTPGDCAAAIQEMTKAGVQCVTSDRWLADQSDSFADASRTKLIGGRFIQIMKT